MRPCSLSQALLAEYHRLVKIVTQIPPSVRILKILDGTGGKVSVVDLIAYQIGWGKCLIRWYETGTQGKMPEMPGDGFSTWDYLGIAQHFYQKYPYVGVWLWCTLPAGKQWPLSKWIRVNTGSPYKRAAQLIKRGNFHKADTEKSSTA